MPKLLPSRTKYRKVHKGRIRGSASRGNTVAFGEFGIQSLSRGRMTSNQIEAARVAINRHLKRKGKVWIRVFPHKPVTKKPAETRMGKGKGSPDVWVAVVKRGRIFCEIGGVPEARARAHIGRRRVREHGARTLRRALRVCCAASAPALPSARGCRPGLPH